MGKLDEIFGAPSEASLPPIVRYCKQRSEAGDRIEVELSSPDDRLGLARPDLVIHRWEQGQEQAPRQVEWDDGLNGGLVDLGIRAIALGQEGERFALGIRAALRKVERRYGDGYLNAVLIDLLDESDLAHGGEIAEVRQFVHANSPERGQSYDACRELIAGEIGGRAVELRDKLKYKPEEVKTVMTKALAKYLDGRFSVSGRRALGWL